MVFDDRSADRKSHAEAFGFCREERFEDALSDGRIKSRAGVFDRNQHAARLGETRGYDKLPRPFRNPFHRVDAIHHQVQQHLLQLNSVAQDRAAARGQVGFKNDAIAPQFAADERQRFSYDFVDVEIGQSRSGLLGERPQTSDHVVRAGAVPRYGRERVSGFVEIRVLPVQPV